MLVYHPTPIQEIIGHPCLKKTGIRLLVKREDLNHPQISGNKWWKLNYNLEAARKMNHRTILTFGGAFSNQIYATAAAARELNLKAIGVIRGEENLPLNPTLEFAAEQGMKIHYMSRASYKHKMTARSIEQLHKKFGAFYLIPEGGSNFLAVKGCAEFAENELTKINFDYLCLPVGTGGTMAGLICGLKDSKNIIGVSVLKDGEFLKAEVQKMVKDFSEETYNCWSILTNYHHGGYAKVTPELVTFIKDMKGGYDIPLDPVYTGKLFWSVIKEIEAGSFRNGSTILVLHTGGLQGNYANVG